MLQAFSGGRRHNIDAALGQIGFVGQTHLALTSAEERLKHFLEVRVDAFKGFLEAAARFGVEFLNGLLGIANGIEQVLPLGVQKLITLLCFLILFERLWIHGAQRFDARADLLIALFGLVDEESVPGFATLTFLSTAD